MADPKYVSNGGIGWTLRLIGLELSKKRNLKLSPALTIELAQLLTVAALTVDAKAKGRAAVDTGRLRSAIFPSFSKGELVSEVRARSKYAAFVEFGTGPLGASTNTQKLPAGYAHGPAYFPPSSALHRWAERHGITGASAGYLVARKIFQRGGTRARPFLGPSFEEEKGPLVRKMQGALDRAKERAKR